ncbi:hypothetical protein BKA70DRAFT_1226491 [Coprinopsis sp. MPI-PUGE-AT-0042]|nr:hypothetical protein BKA70DRAFT_1226491 [Coprinopsis sp. MPI-PUGE-AT-0042]
MTEASTTRMPDTFLTLRSRSPAGDIIAVLTNNMRTALRDPPDHLVQLVHQGFGKTRGQSEIPFCPCLSADKPLGSFDAFCQSSDVKVSHLSVPQGLEEGTSHCLLAGFRDEASQALMKDLRRISKVASFVEDESMQKWWRPWLSGNQMQDRVSRCLPGCVLSVWFQSYGEPISSSKGRGPDVEHVFIAAGNYLLGKTQAVPPSRGYQWKVQRKNTEIDVLTTHNHKPILCRRQRGQILDNDPRGRLEVREDCKERPEKLDAGATMGTMLSSIALGQRVSRQTSVTDHQEGACWSFEY